MRITTCLSIVVVSFFLTDKITAQSNDTLCIKIASVYENISIGEGTSGFIDMPTEIAQIKDPETEFVFRAFWRWSYVPDSSETAPDTSYVLKGYTYKQLIAAIQQIKDSVPGIKICGGFPAQNIDSIEINDLTHDTLDTVQTWAMALDPQKWSIPVTKDSIQEFFSSLWYNPGIIPDITDTNYQKLVIDWAKKQINCGVDAIWIDMLYNQAKIMEMLTGDTYHTAVQESYNAATDIIDQIHNYGDSIGKYIYVGTWSAPARRLPYPNPPLDFVTETVTPNEIYYDSLETSKWTFRRDSIIDAFGNIPILVFIDWGYKNSPIEIFSQQLNSQQQKEFLAKVDTFFYNRNMTFTYPVQGGDMGDSASVLSFGFASVYHAAAPEFATLDTIRILGTTKKPLPWYCDTITTVAETIVPKNTEIIEIFPNPASTHFTFTYSSHNSSENLRMEIYNSIGRLALYKEFRDLPPGFARNTIKLNGLPTGMYHIRFTSGALMQTCKLSVVK